MVAKLRDLKVHAVNLGVPGYGPNHVLRAFEAGLLDRYTDKHVKAVVLWIIPAHLARVTGEGSWLGSSPRYVLEDGKPHYTGSFDQHRIRNPLAGLRYLLGEQFAFVEAIGKRQRQQEQSELIVAIIARLQVLAREKFGAPLVIDDADAPRVASRRCWHAPARPPAQGRRSTVLSRLLGTKDAASFLRTMVDLLTSRHDGHRNGRNRRDDRARHYTCSGITGCSSVPRTPAGSPALVSAARIAARNRSGTTSPTSAQPAVARYTGRPATRTTGAR